MSRPFRGVLVLCVLTACQANLSVPSDARLSCKVDGDCPKGFVCVQGTRCVLPTGAGATPPAINGKVTVTPSDHPGKAQTTFGIDFAVSKALQQIDVELELSPKAPAACSATGDLTYHCTYTATGQENDQHGGDVYFDVNMTDTSGLSASYAAVGSLQMDFTSPIVLPGTASMQLIPGPDNPLSSVQSATVGTTIRLIFATSEALATEPSVEIPASPGLTFTQTTAANTSYVFSATVTGATGLTQGPQVVNVSLQDLAGNTNTLALDLPAPGLVIRTQTPALSVAQSQVMYVRSPWGNASGDTVGSMSITGPYFVLAPTEGDLAGSTLPMNTFQLDTSTIQLVRVWGDAGKAARLGQLAPTNGVWPLLPLAQVDLPTVYVTGLDDAGNESAPIKIQNVDWVATPAASAAGTPAIEALPAAETNRLAHSSTSRTDASIAAGTAATPATSQMSAIWRNATPTQSPQGFMGFSNASPVYDPDHGRVLVLSSTNHVWEWDGYRWLEDVPSGATPPIPQSFSWVYEDSRGRALLWDWQNNLLNEWDGSSWTSTMAPPFPNMDAGALGGPATFDANRGRTVIFDSEANGDPSYPLFLWEWDGSMWTPGSSEGTGLSARSDFSVVYDPDLRGIVLFGGLAPSGFAADLWLWNGTTWSPLPASGAVPPGRTLAGLAYDVARHRLVMSGGLTANPLTDTWEWDGSKWTEVIPSGAPTSVDGDSRMTYDAVRQRTVLIDLTTPATWEWDGQSWTSRTSIVTPAAESDLAMTYDPIRQTSVIFGTGSTSNLQVPTTLLEWDGVHWNLIQPGSGPVRTSRPAMTYDSQLDLTLMFGGFVGTGESNLLWGWDGANWIQLSSGDGPQPREDASLVFDESRQEVVLVGGTDEVTHFTDLWEWDLAGWHPSTVTLPSVPPTGGIAMAFDPLSARTVLAGATSGVWDWNGTAWTQEGTTASKGPSVRDGARAVWDAVRQQLLLFGGDLSSSHLWAWDGQGWSDVTPPGDLPGPRFGHGLTYDSVHSQVMLFGGTGTGGSALDDAWLMDESQPEAPAVQFTVDASKAGFLPSNVTGLHVRALCGGQAPNGNGAALQGWAVGEVGEPAAAWHQLGMPTTSAQPGWIDWSATDPTEAQRYMLQADRLLSFRCASAGSSTVGANTASVALQFIEAHVRYLAP